MTVYKNSETKHAILYLHKLNHKQRKHNEDGAINSSIGNYYNSIEDTLT